MSEDYIQDLSSAGKLEPYKKDKPFWKRMVNVPNAIFVISLMLILIYFFTTSGPSQTINSNAIKETEMNKPKLLEIYYFYENSGDCSNCAEGKKFLENLKSQYSQINLRIYETAFDPDNREILNKFMKDYSVKSPSIPMIFIENRYFIGYSAGIGEEIKSYVENFTLSS